MEVKDRRILKVLEDMKVGDTKIGKAYRKRKMMALTSHKQKHLDKLIKYVKRAVNGN